MSARHQLARLLRRLASEVEVSAQQRQTDPLRNVMASATRPGSRVVSERFFDRYPRFYGSSETAAYVGRLALRYEAIFAENRDILNGARVLDLASHDGRWSLAALASGAESVVGIEARPDLVEHAYANLAAYGYGDDRATFVTGDVFDVLQKRDFDVDVILCLGFLYHTLRYNELFHAFRAINPRHLIIDTQAWTMMDRKAIVYLQMENVSRQRDAVADQYSYANRMLSGRPNLNAIHLMLNSYGFEVERLSDWPGLVRDNPRLAGGVRDYAVQKRVTLRCRNESD